MDAYRGSLTHFRMHLLIPALFERDPQSGAVRVHRGGLHREFLLHRGFLVAQSSNEPREHLGQVLVDLGILDTERAAAAFEGARRAKLPLGAFLVQQRVVDRARLEAALQHKAREAFFDCYSWEVGELEFTPCEVPAAGLELKMQLGTLHRDAMARQREWRTFHALFPDLDGQFRVDAARLGADAEAEDLTLIALAESGAALGELLTSAPDGRIRAARRVIKLYRRGALSPRRSAETLPDDSMRLAQLIALARSALSRSRYEEAMTLAARALERGPVEEAHALYREAELRHTLALSDEVLNLEGRLEFRAIPRPVPAELTADDLYLYKRLRQTSSVREVMRTAPMGESAAYRSMKRLVQSGVLGIDADARLRGTLRYGPR